MKIALVSPYDYSYPGGVTTHILNLERHLTAMGHQVKILAPCSRKVSYVGPNTIPLGRTVVVPSGGSFARITLSPRLWLQVRRVLEQERFDLIHAHEPLTPALPPIVLSQARVPKVGTFHAYHDKPRGYFLTRPILSRWFRHLDACVAVSRPALDFISRHFPGNYELIPNGVDTEFFSPAVLPLEQFCDGKRNILFVGRLERRKGIDYLLAAFRLIKRELPESRLIIVGPQSRLGLDYRVLAEGIPDVVFGGAVPYSELPRYYASAQVVCAPATGEESFGMVLLEAMATAKPVVASDIPGFAQVLTAGQEGLLVPPRKDLALTQALLHLLLHPEVGAEMGRRGRHKALDYDWSKITQRIVALYQRLVA